MLVSICNPFMSVNRSSCYFIFKYASYTGLYHRQVNSQLVSAGVPGLRQTLNRPSSAPSVCCHTTSKTLHYGSKTVLPLASLWLWVLELIKKVMATHYFRFAIVRIFQNNNRFLTLHVTYKCITIQLVYL